ncbi:hypothetical protein BRD17_04820 [Halobacteriales archaeon SW_7_68_16]|nr:MAG: hypothetical protein BRD17_04820 [Halobacteriales archaeon SW_7_68_16]
MSQGDSASRGNDEEYDDTVTDTGALVGLAVSVIVGVGALFILPFLRSQGLGFFEAFWVAAGLELIAALGVAYYVLNLYVDPGE